MGWFLGSGSNGQVHTTQKKKSILHNNSPRFYDDDQTPSQNFLYACTVTMIFYLETKHILAVSLLHLLRSEIFHLTLLSTLSDPR